MGYRHFHKPFESDSDRMSLPEGGPSPVESPVVTYLNDIKKWRLELPFSYLDKETRIMVPDQFEFDLASIPRLFWWLIAPFELSISAPLIHDFLYLYRGNPPSGLIIPPRTYTRYEADTLFRTLMIQEGIPAWRCAAAYIAVRCCGWYVWMSRGRNT